LTRLRTMGLETHTALPAHLCHPSFQPFQRQIEMRSLHEALENGGMDGTRTRSCYRRLRGERALRHLFSGSSVALFSPFPSRWIDS